MQRLAMLLILFGMLINPALAQEQNEAPPEDEPAVAESTADDEEEADADAADPVRDDEFYQDIDDEDFRPSEEIPADQSITFPSDI